MVDLDRFAGCPVLVVGDLMLDEFIWGGVNRISPEAPVPIVEVKRRTYAAGGAANTAANIASLGGKAFIAGVVGRDLFGGKVVEVLRGAGVETGLVQATDSRATTSKTRVIAHNQQMVRFDEETTEDLDAATMEALLKAVEEGMPGMKACVVSDYGKGVASPAFLKGLMAAAKKAGVPVIVDPKGTQYAKYRGAALVKPNLAEAGQVLNRKLGSDSDIEKAGADLRELLWGASVLITRGPQGMSLFEDDRAPFHLPAKAREVYDVTGAGDTVAGTLALAVAAGASLPDACRLATEAAALVVQKVGTATVGLEELRSIWSGCR